VGLRKRGRKKGGRRGRQRERASTRQSTREGACAREGGRESGWKRRRGGGGEGMGRGVHGTTRRTEAIESSSRQIARNSLRPIAMCASASS